MFPNGLLYQKPQPYQIQTQPNQELYHRKHRSGILLGHVSTLRRMRSLIEHVQWASFLGPVNSPVHPSINYISTWLESSLDEILFYSLLQMFSEALHRESDPDPDPHLKPKLWYPSSQYPHHKQRRLRKYQKRYQVHRISNVLNIYEMLWYGGLTHFSVSHG